ncbi:MAG: molybdenum cofactor biosynthesis protein MoaE [Planctomycetes bacterium]|nr:molybdenum cofactor biosynthesis protein MoaE [Planctomycetota bacterium]
MRVRYFSICRAATGRDEEAIPARDGPTVGALLEHLRRRHPGLAPHAASLRVAVNHEFAPASRPLSDADEVALLPPVQGGKGQDDPEGTVSVLLTREPIDLPALLEAARAEGAGAVATFTGIVRPGEAGRAIRAIEYEAYDEMARRELARIAREARARAGILAVAVVHRTGPVPAGEAAVAIAVASGHRAEAFETCRWIIDRIKETVPVWKHHLAV